MVILGTDARKRSHTVVACDEVGTEIGTFTVSATPQGHLRLVKWAARYTERRWAIEDCRALSRRLEAESVASRGTGGAGASQVDGWCAPFGAYSGQV